LAEWLYEDGIGEERAILVQQGQIIEARILPHDGVKAGLVAQAQLVKQVIAGKRGIAKLPDGAEVLLSPLPAGLTEGGSLIVEVTRAAIDEKSRFKLPLARPAIDKSPQPAPGLRERIGDMTLCHAHGADRFVEYGWHEVAEEARSGEVSFTGGSLLISVTPAMTLIDVDGALPPLPLALTAAKAAAEAIRRLDIQGMIGIDFPGVADKSERLAVAEAFDAAMTGPFERTAINGFGFLQLVKRRTGPSLLEILQHRRVRGHTNELLRMAERDARTGPLTLAAHPAVIALLESRPEWLAELGKRTGRAVSLRADPKLAIGGYYAE
jgi:Ribonuclease E/G family